MVQEFKTVQRLPQYLSPVKEASSLQSSTVQVLPRVRDLEFMVISNSFCGYSVAATTHIITLIVNIAGDDELHRGPCLLRYLPRINHIDSINYQYRSIAQQLATWVISGLCGESSPCLYHLTIFQVFLFYT